MDCSSAQSQENPFKATQIWQEAIRSFRIGMPCSKHRIKMHCYSSCFTGQEAVHWLHAHLQSTALFGTTISQEQVEKLLQKFLASNVITEVRGKLRLFKPESCYLYRFVTEPGPFNFLDNENTPLRDRGEGGGVKSPTVTPSAALGKRKREARRELEHGLPDCDGTLFANEYASTSGDESMSITPLGGRDSGGVASYPIVTPKGRLGSGSGAAHPRAVSMTPKSRHGSGGVPMTVGSPTKKQKRESKKETDTIAKVWKELTLNRLLLLVELPSLDGVLQSSSSDVVDGHHIAHNVAALARAVGGACSSAAQSCLATVSGVSQRGSLQEQPHPPPPPACHIRKSTRQSSPHFTRSLNTRHCHSNHHHHGNHLHAAESTGDEDFPRWLLLALNCLSKWPSSCSEEFVGGMPMYSGFELDVLQSVLRYLRSTPQPLISAGLVDIFMTVQRVLVRADHAHSIEALQLCCLLLPGPSCTRLHHLLRFINKASANSQLCISRNQSNQSALLDQFGPIILRKSKKSSSASSSWEEDCRVLLQYMAQHYHSIFKVPRDLREEVEKRLEELKAGKGSPLEIRHVFCKQVSASQYQQETGALTQQWLKQLLEDIVRDCRMTKREKLARLKTFQTQYPDIYLEKIQKEPQLFASLGGESSKCSRKGNSKHF